MRDLASEIVRLQTELDREIEQRRKTLGWRFKDHLVEFEHGVTLEQRRLKKKIGRFLRQTPPSVILTAPVIYSLIVPMMIVDAWVSAYQAICFRAYGIPQVPRRQYILLDRGHLAYLNWIQALNCQFCGYAGGVIAYAREIASRTEQYWCPIKHALRASDPHQRYYQFLEFGDAEGYRDRLDAFRQALRTEDAMGPEMDT